MATVIRPEISIKNKYWISKHRHYELKHFCLQYNGWKKAYSYLSNSDISISTIDRLPSGNIPGDPTTKRALLRAYYSERIDLIEKKQSLKQIDIYANTY